MIAYRREYTFVEINEENHVILRQTLLIIKYIMVAIQFVNDAKWYYLNSILEYQVHR